MLGLQTPVWILHFQHRSIWTRHVPGTQHTHTACVAQMRLLPTSLTSIHTIFFLHKKDSALVAFFSFLGTQICFSPQDLCTHCSLCLEQFCTLRISQHLNFHVILSVTCPARPPPTIISKVRSSLAEHLVISSEHIPCNYLFIHLFFCLASSITILVQG